MDTRAETLSHGLEAQGLYNPNRIFWNPPTPALYEQALLRHEGFLAHLGALVVGTGHHAGRSAEDKFIVDEAGSHDHMWWGTINKPIDEHSFEMPQSCPGVADTMLRPRELRDDPDAYDAQAGKLAEMFSANFVKYADEVEEDVREAGPRPAI